MQACSRAQPFLLWSKATYCLQAGQTYSEELYNVFSVREAQDNCNAMTTWVARFDLRQGGERLGSS